MQPNDRPQAMQKLATGISGFDHLALGGLPAGRSTLVAGTAGAGKTVFAAHFLAAGILQFDQPGVFVTFEESPDAIRRNLAGFGWDIGRWEAAGRWAFVDAAPSFAEDIVVAGGFDLGGLLARVTHAVQRIGANRVVVDSLGSVFDQMVAGTEIRRELLRLAAVLRDLDVTAVVTAERREEYGEIARLGIEEFVADNVVILRNTLEVERRRRSLEILKLRGCDHRKGEHPFTVRSDEGIVVVPLSSMTLAPSSADTRISTGSPALDAICGGGLFRDSVSLVSGATGCGKTLLATTFVAAGAAAGERALLLGFEESRPQLRRNASAWGSDLEAGERAGLVRLECAYPESCELDEHLIRIRQTIEAWRPVRVAVDSLTALERIGSERTYRQFVVALTSHLKELGIAALYTSTSDSLLGGDAITDAHISTITDTILLMRYVEMFGEVRRGLTVLKMRGSKHDHSIREFAIEGSGLHIGEPFANTSGIIAGRPIHMSPREIYRLEEMRPDREEQ